MRILLRILKGHANQQLPTCFITLNTNKKSFTYSINTGADVYKEWNYYKHSQSDSGFRSFYTRFDVQHISGIFGLISILDGRSSLNQFQFFGCNKFMEYFQHLRHCFGVKILKMSAASFEKNDYDFVALSTKEQLEQLFKNYQQNSSVLSAIKELFSRDTLNASRDNIKYDEANKLYYYEDQALRNYAIDIYSESPQDLQDKQFSKKFAFHICEKIENKKSIDSTKLQKDIPKQFLKQLFAKGQIQIDNKIYHLRDYQVDEENSQFLILELQNDEEVDQFLSHSYLKSDMFKNSEMIVHLSPKNVLENPKFAKFIQENSKMVHLITASGYYSEKYDDINYHPFSFVNYNQYLSKLFPGILPHMNPHYFQAFLKKDQNLPIENSSFYHKNVKLALSPEIVHIKHNQIQFQYMGPSSIIFNESGYNDLLKNNKYLNLQKNLLSYQEKIKENVNKSFPEIITLGTSSSYATLLRNVSSYLIKTNLQNSILLDCGHGTVHQLRKQFGTHDEKLLYEQIKKIQMIVVSHHHSDHHYGIIEFLETRMELFKKYQDHNQQIPKILIVVPNLIYAYLQSTIEIQPDLNAIIMPHSNVSVFQLKIRNMNFLNVQKVMTAWKQETPDDDEDMIDFEGEDPKIKQKIEKLQKEHNDLFKAKVKEMGLKDVFLFPINHCVGSRSIKLEFPNGKKIVYSGDGRLNLKFQNIIQDADILIHEATYSIERKAEALDKAHSIFDEVVQFAKSLNVKCLIVSHYSPNATESLLCKNIDAIDYKYKYQLDKQIENYINTKTIFANDHLVINEDNMNNLPLASRIIIKVLQP